MSPGSSTESYPTFAHIGLRENPGKNLNQATCPNRESNPPPGFAARRANRYSTGVDSILLDMEKLRSRDLLLHLQDLGFRVTETVRENRMDGFTLQDTKLLQTAVRESYDYTFDTNSEILFVKWDDNRCVPVGSNCDVGASASRLPFGVHLGVEGDANVLGTISRNSTSCMNGVE
ncbi:hypothetical protein ANN_01271 [Periplaneta americana]|uniref:Uncharacterized protein n=1 Tax=Periplaneta americana TaxID=6978 RepID=A0ABQ8TX57_PERAM|nr:hypothetical protein ANN_01271 [Periplaneta americana]